MINSCNEWDPLEEIIVGLASHANWPMTDPVFAEEARNTLWKETPAPSGPVPDFIIDQSNRELDILAETLLRYGATVYRPKPMDFVKEKGMYNYCPRDRLLVAGDTLVDVNMMYPCRNQESKNYTRLFGRARNIFTMPRDEGMTLDAANVLRLNDDMLYLLSPSGNLEAYHWLCDQFSNVNIELCNFYSGVHIDSTIVPIREGLVLLNASRVNVDNCPGVFDDWDKLWIKDVVAQDFYRYPYASKWIGLNMLVVNPETVIMDWHQIHIRQKLEKMGINVIPLPMRHSRTLGGGFHCVTLDLVRNHK